MRLCGDPCRSRAGDTGSPRRKMMTPCKDRRLGRRHGGDRGRPGRGSRPQAQERGQRRRPLDLGLRLQSYEDVPFCSSPDPLLSPGLTLPVSGRVFPQPLAGFQQLPEARDLDTARCLDSDRAPAHVTMTPGDTHEATVSKGTCPPPGPPCPPLPWPSGAAPALGEQSAPRLSPPGRSTGDVLRAVALVP